MNARAGSAPQPTAPQPTAPRGASGYAAVPWRTRLRATTRSEWIKFRSVRSAPSVLLATAAVLLVGAWLVSAGYRDGWATMSPTDRAAFDPVYQSMRGIELAQLFLGALGVLTVTSEYTSGLIRGTFTATPQRRQVLATKALVLAAVVGGGLYLALVGLLGLFTGALLRRTPAALAALFGVLLVLPVAVGMLPGRVGALLGEFMPSTAGSEVWQLVHTGAYTLGPWQGFGVLAGYVSAAGAAALALIRRRDV
jgi:hypothetical protein